MKKSRDYGRVVCIGKKLNSILFAQNAQNNPPLKTVHFEDTRFVHFVQNECPVQIGQNDIIYGIHIQREQKMAKHYKI